MKYLAFTFLLSVLLTACGTQVTPAPLSPTHLPVAAPTDRGAATNQPSIPTPSQATSTAPAPNQPVIHSSTTDPNAKNIVTVRDQPLDHHSLTIDSVTAVQAGWIALYLYQHNETGVLIGYAPVPAGKSNQVIVPMRASSTGVPYAPQGRQVIAILYIDAGKIGTFEYPGPDTPVEEGGHRIMVVFNVVSAK
jgi:hypothetical protein